MTSDFSSDPHPATADSQASPLHVCSFESRRAAEMRSLIERNGGRATVVPSMQETPIEENPDAMAFAEALLAGQVDVVIFLTGVGAQALLQAVASQFDRAEFLEALRRCELIVRGPKPQAVLREWGLHVEYRAPEPNTWRELLVVLDANISIAGKTVAVQEYGRTNPDLCRELEQRGAKVLRVPVYRWTLPEDTGPLLDAIQGTVDGRFDVLMFTSATQLDHILQVADRAGLRDRWLEAANRCVVACIGPVASEALSAAGLAVDLEPSHPKMGHLVLETLKSAAAILQAKQEPR